MCNKYGDMTICINDFVDMNKFLDMPEWKQTVVKLDKLMTNSVEPFIEQTIADPDVDEAKNMSEDKIGRVVKKILNTIAMCITYEYYCVNECGETNGIPQMNECEMKGRHKYTVTSKHEIPFKASGQGKKFHAETEVLVTAAYDECVEGDMNKREPLLVHAPGLLGVHDLRSRRAALGVDYPGLHRHRLRKPCPVNIDAHIAENIMCHTNECRCSSRCENEIISSDMCKCELQGWHEYKVIVKRFLTKDDNDNSVSIGVLTEVESGPVYADVGYGYTTMDVQTTMINCLHMCKKCSESIDKSISETNNMRKIKDGSVVRGVPMAVKCEWTPLKIENLDVIDAKVEDVQRNKPCNEHDYCMGPQYSNPVDGTYLILNGTAKKDEIISSDSNLMSQMVMNGKKTAADLAKHCYDKIAKKGVLRKQNNIEVSERVMHRALFTYVAEDGKCSMRNLKDGEVVVIGRCPSQGPDSTVPVKVWTGSPGVNSIRTPLELCNLANLDFDGDEEWLRAHMTQSGKNELETRWHQFWIENPPKPVFESVYRVAVRNKIDTRIDLAVLTTITFKEMSEHKGGEIYESMLLKPKSWKRMYKVMTSNTYWKSCVTRGMAGMMNAITSRHGLAGLYGLMRTGMMLGTCVNVIDGMIRIASKRGVNLPNTYVPKDMVPLASPTALTKMTKVMYQKGFDMSKHGGGHGKPIDTLMGSDVGSYAMVANNCGVQIVYYHRDNYPNVNIHGVAGIYTNMQSILYSSTPIDMIKKACTVTSMIEVIDGVELTAGERLMASYFFSFLSMYLNGREVVNRGMIPIEVVMDLGLDWYTSVTNFMAWFAGSNGKPVRWTKMSTTMNTDARDIDTESEIEPIIKAMNKNIHQNSSENNNRSETEDDDSDDSDDDDDGDESDNETKGASLQALDRNMHRDNIVYKCLDVYTIYSRRILDPDKYNYSNDAPLWLWLMVVDMCHVEKLDDYVDDDECKRGIATMNPLAVGGVNFIITEKGSTFIDEYRPAIPWYNMRTMTYGMSIPKKVKITTTDYNVNRIVLRVEFGTRFHYLDPITDMYDYEFPLSAELIVLILHTTTKTSELTTHNTATRSTPSSSPGAPVPTFNWLAATMSPAGPPPGPGTGAASSSRAEDANVSTDTNETETERANRVLAAAITRDKAAALLGKDSDNIKIDSHTVIGKTITYNIHIFLSTGANSNEEYISSRDFLAEFIDVKKCTRVYITDEGNYITRFAPGPVKNAALAYTVTKVAKLEAILKHHGLAAKDDVPASSMPERIAKVQARVKDDDIFSFAPATYYMIRWVFYAFDTVQKKREYGPRRATTFQHLYL
ncbi:hypothetical protein FNAPI_13539 [Fusarium napiforme]|uniref:Uncharacterized protein n=1 Tax=Fusarium napiforme TaxID=42672 RepID=A0A8H5I5C5_9HYPO|nr:hypothetical protein FNAPI_13539 [Fusarium napiforme]